MEQQPESACETSSHFLAFSDFQKLTTQQLDDVCTWLTYMFCSSITDCVNIDLREKSDLVGTADGNALMVYEGWRRFLKVTGITHCKHSCSSCWAHSLLRMFSMQHDHDASLQNCEPHFATYLQTHCTMAVAHHCTFLAHHSMAGPPRR